MLNLTRNAMILAVLCLLSSSLAFGSVISGDADTPPGIDDGCFNCGFIGIRELNIVLADWNKFSPPANPEADWSGDGYVGIDDLNTVLSNWNAGTPPGELFGCLNDLGGDGCGGDGFIGIDDLNLVLGNWNFNVPPANPAADHSGPGYIGIDDLNWVLSNWNAGTPPTSSTVPEPAALALLGFGSLALLRGRDHSWGAQSHSPSN